MRLLLLVTFVSSADDCLEEGSGCYSGGECVVDSHFGDYIFYPLGESDFPVTTIDAHQVNNSVIVDLTGCQNECVNYAGCYQMHYDGQACTLFNDVPQVADETFSTKLESCDSSDIYDYYFDMKFYCLFTLYNGQTGEEFLEIISQYNSDDWRFLINKSWWSFNYAYTYRYRYVIPDSIPSGYSAAGANQVWIAFEGEFYMRWAYGVASFRRRRQSENLVDDLIEITSEETAADFQATIVAPDATVVETTANERGPIEAVNRNLFSTTTNDATTTSTTTSIPKTTTLTTTTGPTTTTTATTTPIPETTTLTTTTEATTTTTTTTTESSAVFMGFNLLLSAIFICL